MNLQIRKLAMVLLGIVLNMTFSVDSLNAQDNPNRNLYTSGDYQSGSLSQYAKKHTSSFKDGAATITILVEDYLYPSSIDPTGTNVVIVPFGQTTESIHWTAEGGISILSGDAKDVNAEGKVGGTFINDQFPGGGSAETAGTWDAGTQEWTFIGMNPEYPTASSEGYNVGWGMSDDGNTVVGMQWHDGWSVTAFKWNETDGYTMLDYGLSYDTRATGICRNGEVIYGWVTSDMGYWRPMIWKNDTYTLVAGDESGEVMCASPEGTYVAGILDWNAFYWSEDGGLVNFGTDQDFPTVIMEDGAVFGFNTVFPPTFRTAFYKDPEGNMMSFNDYAEARGMENAQEWTFYSINDATPDGNKFIGAGVNPDGQDVCFLIDFSEEVQTYNLNLSANPTEGGEVTGAGEFEAGMAVEIEAIANENYAFIDWTNAAGDVVSEEPVTTIIMEENTMTLIAHFQSTVGITQVSENDITFYPNPATDKLTINAGSGIQQLQIFNQVGQIARQIKTDNANITLDVSDLESGIYFIKVFSGDTIIIRKLVIE